MTPRHDPIACSAGFIDKIRRICGEQALVEWDRIALDYEAYIAEATPMWFFASMDLLCHKHHPHPEADYNPT